jgi:hypothetical protein
MTELPKKGSKMGINMITPDQLKYLSWASTQPSLAPVLEQMLASYRRSSPNLLMKSEAWAIINTLKMKAIV